MKKLFVGNMSLNTTESDLLARFEGFGEIDSVQIVANRERGRTRGFAFIEMRSDEQANRAIASINGQQLCGLTLTVREAQPRANH